MKTPLPRSAAPGLAPFLRHLGLFLLPLTVVGALLLHVPLSRSFAWNFVRGDSGAQGNWLHARIQARPEPIDVAFVGTSRSMFAVADDRIERALRAAGHPLGVATLGYPRHGRNMNHVIVQELLEARPVRHLFLEVGVGEHGGSHPLYGYVASSDDLLGAPLVADTDFPVDLYRGLLVRLDQVKHAALGLPRAAPHADIPVHQEAFRSPPDYQVPARILEAAWARRHARAARMKGAHDGRVERPHHYLRAIAELAAQRGTQLHFLYMPVYGWPWPRMTSRALYEELGDVWIPPKDIFRDRANWCDEAHFNRQGAERFSDWLVERILARE